MRTVYPPPGGTPPPEGGAYGQPPGESGPRNGALVLVLGILSFVGCGCLTGIPAWVIGNSSLAEIEAGRQPMSERSLVDAGRILGIISTLLYTAGACIYLSFFAMVVPTATITNINWDDTSWEKYDRSSKVRRYILDAAIRERTTHSEKDYSSLSEEIKAALDKGEPWNGQVTDAAEGCGKIEVNAEGGMLTLTDDCGSDYLYGWPAQKAW